MSLNLIFCPRCQCTFSEKVGDGPEVYRIEFLCRFCLEIAEIEELKKLYELSG